MEKYTSQKLEHKPESKRNNFYNPNFNFGLKGFFDYIPEPYSKYLSVNNKSERKNGSNVKASLDDMMFMLMAFMILC